ncbi:hypothetical protein QOZ80_3AG0217000 [Eleusine coracana subsp. coracana]|nr:hypothetical protein QOZ80_3AG0217000 [Eleusine coracana subsp. coracana]
MASSRRRRRARSRSATVTNKKRKTPRGATLPDDLVVQGLLRVPAAALARLRRVCRSWNAEISSPGFQQRHHALASTKLGFLPLAPSHGVFVRFGSSPIERCINCHDCPRVIGSKPCHGLVLVYRPCADEQAYSVWNPTTGEILHLPFLYYPHFIIGMGVITVGDHDARGWRSPAGNNNSSSLFEIWKLQDYDAGSWSLDYRVDVTPGHVMTAERLTKPWLVVPLRYLDRGRSSRKLLVTTMAQEAHVYDPEDGTLRMVTSSIAKGGGNSDDSVRLLMYQESLFRFPGMKQGNGEIEFVQLDCCIE